MEQKSKNIGRYIGLGISIIIVILAGWLIYQYFHTIKDDESIVDDLKSKIVGTDAYKDYRPLWELNHDFVGWLKIDDTPIDYPVMQSKNDEQFYLHRNFYKQYNYEGTLFCRKNDDVIRPSDNILIYGHHMRTNTMFHCLDQYEDQEFYENHKYITFDTLASYGTYEVIAAFRTDVNPGHYEYWKFIESDKDKFDEYVNYAKTHSTLNIDTTAEYGDKLLSLSTCAYHVKNGRFVVVAKKIESEEPPYDVDEFLKEAGIKDTRETTEYDIDNTSESSINSDK